MLSPARKEKIEALLNKLNIKSKDIVLFDEALTHSSYNMENEHNKGYDYERLEFLGDSVLRMSASDYLYNKFPDYAEGKLTKIRSCLVSDKFLSNAAFDYGIAEYIDLGTGEEHDKGRTKESILACTMEAVFGAVYLSLGFDTAKEFVCGMYKNIKIDEIMMNYNSKEILQEYTQAKNKDLPKYNVIEENGPAHNKTYTVGVFYHEEELGRASAKTKKEAEQLAALEAIKRLNIAEGKNG